MSGKLVLDLYRTPIILCNNNLAEGGTNFDCAVVFITMIRLHTILRIAIGGGNKQASQSQGLADKIGKSACKS